MVTKLPHEFRKYVRNSLHLSRILEETKKAVKDIDTASIISEDELENCILSSLESERLSHMLSEKPIMIVFGQSSSTNAHFVNAFLDCGLLPTTAGDWRWLRILFGRVGHVSLTVGLEFEVMDKLRSHETPWTTVSEEDLLRPSGEEVNLEHVQFLEIERCHPALRDGLQIVVPPILDPSRPGDRDCLQHVVQFGLKPFLPLLVYTVESTVLSDQDMKRLADIREVFPDSPVFFVVNVMASLYQTKDGLQSGNNNINGVRNRGPSNTELTESEQHALEQQQKQILDDEKNLENLDDSYFAYDSQYVSRLVNLGYLSEEDVRGQSKCTHNERFCRSTVIVEGLDQLDSLLPFVRGVLRSHLVDIASLLNDVHTGVLRRFILCAFDMAREIQITPRRMKYAIEKEMELYRSLMRMASEQQAEVTLLITATLEVMREQLIEDAAGHEYRGSEAGYAEANSTSRAARVAAEEIQKLVLSRLTHSVARRLMCSMGCMQDSVVGTLQRTLCSLERPDRANSESISLNDSEEERGNLINIHDSSDSFQELNSIDCVMSGSHPGHQLASDALKQILSAAYAVQLSPTTPSSLLFGIFERLRQLLHGFQLPWAAPPRLDAAWRRKIAAEMLDSLSPARLARSISSQFREKVRLSHEHFQAALRSLESHYSGRLERTEGQRVAIRKFHAPRLAKLALESTSMADMVRFGMPQMGREIGRGQYGVVFACESWGGAGPCAVKSVVPPDERHWNDLAMEFYYTRSIPEHPRIVRLRGSVVDHTYGGGSSVAVLLVMDRLTRDLYTGLHDGLVWRTRLRIAVDVVEGIRYLHSQGLVHRDIKLKNVLLDCDNRAKLTDLGFCIPEAMMSGSIVGTPIHMAPELLSGQYDSRVDVYAFGILFWYICAGSVRLPVKFDKFHNKEQLWTSVRKGVRPERLAQFDDDCWQLMEQCWNGDPAERPLLGSVQPQLEAIMKRYTLSSPVIES